MLLAAALAATLSILVGHTTAPGSPLGSTRDVHSGRAGRTDVRIPRIEATIVIDGTLDDAVWESAALLTGFSEYMPVDGRPADDSTRVVVWYGKDAIYFGVRAFEAHGTVVRATLANRDNIAADDHVNVLLDTYNSRHQALLSAVNTLGVQEDGVWSDGVGASAGGQNSNTRTDTSIDLNPDYVYESRGHLTDWGYEVEVRIPFKSLHYQGRLDPTTKIISGDVHLINTSDSTFSGPLVVKVLTIDVAGVDIMHADNRESGAGAMWEVTTLPPGKTLGPRKQIRDKRIEFECPTPGLRRSSPK